MHTLIRHVLLPLIAPAAVVGLYLTPVTAIGCVNRGLLALAVVIASALGALYAALRGLRARRCGDPPAMLWWAVSTALLTAPLVLVLGPLG